MKIGIFDSGMGGVSVLHDAFKYLPNEEYIFYADTDHVPYGLKTSDQIIKYVDEIVSFFVSKEVDAVVIACNTATAVAAEYVREKYSIPIIGMEPAVKPALKNVTSPLIAPDSRVLVMATPVTIRENKLHSLLERIDKEHKVDLLPMPELVRFAEEEKFEDIEVEEYIKSQISELNIDKYSEVVLGCTHFTYFRNAVRKAFGRDIDLIDGNEGTIRHLADVLGLKCTDGNDEYDGYAVTSDNKERSIKYNVDYYISGRQADEKELKKFARLHERLSKGF